MLRPQRRATHQEMDAGRSCGACHDGKRAFATSDGERCEGCHTGEAVTP
jgi:c(7)-type cytochrome triheme protein